MTTKTLQTIELDAGAVLNLVKTVLPVLETAGVVGGPVGLGVSAAAGLLLPLLAQIPTGELMTVGQQAELFHRAANLLAGLDGPQWRVSSAAASPA
jgi:hypothetical protein